jgi:polar amino acid transport system substrate-binding protein
MAIGMTTNPAAGQEPAGESILDKAVRTKKLTVAASLKYPPNMFVNAEGQPDGYEIEVMRRMLADITPDLEIEFVDMDFGQMFPAVETGRVDLMTMGTILPSRALRGWFAGCAGAFQPVYVVAKPGSAPVTAEQMNSAEFRFATLQGSSQEAKIRSLYPQAQLAVFPDQAAALGEVMTGRANATLQSLFTIVNSKKQGVQVSLLNDAPAYVDHNTYFLPTGDIKLYMYVTTWLLHNAAGGELNSIFRKHIGADAIAAGLSYLTVGPGGSPMSITA